MDSSDYEPIANEYYDTRHITSRNFDDATTAFCREFDCPVPSKGLVLELGAGKGRTGEYCGVNSSRVIQIDISRTMLFRNPREDCFQRIRCDAIRLPIRSSTVSAVTAFLYDPYNKAELYVEIHRVLKDGGIFVGTLPRHTWGITLRKVLGCDQNRTRFLRRDGYLVELDSFLMSDAEIDQVVGQAGLTLREMYDLCLPSCIQQVSEHISIPAASLGLSVYALPIVKFIIAKKRM